MSRQLLRDHVAMEMCRKPRQEVAGTIEETSQADFIDLLWTKLPQDMEALVRQRGKWPLMLDQMAELLATMVELLKAYPPAQEDALTDLVTVMRAKELINGGYRGAYVWSVED